MGRLIDIDELWKELEILYDAKNGEVTWNDALWKIKRAPVVESTAQQWIPCSEQLPKNNKDVLITCEWGDVEVGWYDGEWNGEGCVYDDDDIIAWMPLPEPWKGEQP